MSTEDRPVTVVQLRGLEGDRCEAALSDGRSLRLPRILAAELSLYTGRELAPEEAERLFRSAALERTKDRALRMIGLRAMSEGEVYQRLVEKGEAEQDAAAAVAWLLELHFLDDAAYAGMVVRHYAAKGFGRKKIENELYRRRVPRELWEEALAELPEQEDTLDRLLRQRLRDNGADPAARRRASDYLLRRGFSWSEVREALERYQGFTQK